nr:uncharacterized protein LOC109768837 [Aegilops tauschii subsp. strangulata]
MENVIFKGRGEAFYVHGQGHAFDPDDTQSQDARGQYGNDPFGDNEEEEAHNHGNSWHEEEDIYCKDEEEEVDIAEEPLFIDEVTQRADTQRRKQSIHMGSYTKEEDILICERWMEIGQDPMKGAEQKGSVFWTRVHKTFQERMKFVSTRGINSIQKRWGFILQECNEYCAMLECVEAHPMSVLGMVDLAFQSSEAFKDRHKNKPFTLTHCWTLIKDCPKFKDQHVALKKKGGKVAEAENGDLLKRPRGRINSKADDKRDASTIALQATLQGMMTQKGVREEQMKIYLELQTKKLDMEEAARRWKLDIEEAAQSKKLATDSTNADTKEKEVALAIMSVDMTNMSPKRKIWFANQHNQMFDQDGLN